MAERKAGMYRGPTGLIVPSLAPVCHTFEEARESNEESAEPINIEFGPGFKVKCTAELCPEDEHVEVTLLESPHDAPVSLILFFSRSCSYHDYYEEKLDPVELRKDTTITLQPSEDHEDDFATYNELNDLFFNDYRYRGVSSYADDEGDTTDYELHFKLHISAIYSAHFDPLEPVDDYKQLGDTFPSFYDSGFSHFVCFNDDPQLDEIEYAHYEYRSVDDQRSTSTNKAATTRTHKTQRKAASSNKRPKLSENSVPSQPQSVRVAVPVEIVECLDLGEHLLALQDENLPLSIIIPYIITLFGGVLHISYPPTLDELVLYMQMIHLHEKFNIPCGDLSRTLYHVVSMLDTFPSFGKLAPDTVIALLQTCWRDYRSDWVIKLVGTLLKGLATLSRTLAALPLDTTGCSSSLALLSYASLSSAQEYLETLRSPFYSESFNFTWENCQSILGLPDAKFELL